MGKLRVTPLNTVPKHRAFVYQEEAVLAIRDLEYAAVFHEQGLGKTKIAIDVLLYWLSESVVDTALVVTKKGLLANWQREFAQHTSLHPRLFSQSRKENFHVFNSPSRVMLCNFEVVVSEFERFKLFLRSRDVGIIIDESAKIKNPQARVTQCLLELGPLFKRRIIMTGTPIANRPYDIWAQIFFLDQGASLGTDFTEFQNLFDLSSQYRENLEARAAFETALNTLFPRISAFAVRETKSGGLIELPEKVIHSVQTTWEDYQYDLYLQYRNDLRATILRDGVVTEDKAEGVLKRLLRLVQVTSNPMLVDQNYSAEPGKLPYLTDLIDQIRDNDEKCIVWTSFNENADWLARQLRPHGTCKIHGKMSTEQRNRSVERFLGDKATRILVATPGAAKEGLTLTVANHVIFYDRSFSLDDYLQAQDRIHRITQQRVCHVYNLVMKESVDEWVDVLLHAKQMAASLGQGDVELQEYQSKAGYDFADILKEGTWNYGD